MVRGSIRRTLPAPGRRARTYATASGMMRWCIRTAATVPAGSKRNAVRSMIRNCMRLAWRASARVCRHHTAVLDNSPKPLVKDLVRRHGTGTSPNSRQSQSAKSALATRRGGVGRVDPRSGFGVFHDQPKIASIFTAASSRAAGGFDRHRASSRSVRVTYCDEDVVKRGLDYFFDARPRLLVVIATPPQAPGFALTSDGFCNLSMAKVMSATGTEPVTPAMSVSQRRFLEVAADYGRLTRADDSSSARRRSVADGRGSHPHWARCPSRAYRERR
jgi:hypothetical protein